MTSEYGTMIRQQRIARGLSQSALASLAGVSRNTVSNAENGQSPSPHTRRRIDTALGLSEPAPSPAPPSLIYTTSDGTQIDVSRDEWDPAALEPREQALCRALLTYALKALDAPTTTTETAS